jgi:hypothetical protein
MLVIGGGWGSERTLPIWRFQQSEQPHPQALEPSLAPGFPGLHPHSALTGEGKPLTVPFPFRHLYLCKICESFAAPLSDTPSRQHL